MPGTMMASFTCKRRTYRPARFAVLPLLLAMAAGCTSSPPLHAGALGAPLPPHTTIALVGTPDDEGPLAIKAREAVTKALAEYGHTITDEAGARLDLGLTDRSAKTGIAIIDGEALSPAKRRRFLQSCDLRTHRLALTYYGGGPAVPITRAWAETHLCKGKFDDGDIAQLARQAVSALVEQTDQPSPATTARVGAGTLTALRPLPAAR